MRLDEMPQAEASATTLLPHHYRHDQPLKTWHASNATKRDGGQPEEEQTQPQQAQAKEAAPVGCCSCSAKRSRAQVALG